MSVDVFQFTCDSLSKAVLVGFKGTEYISRPFQFDIFFTVPSGTNVRAAVGEKATLTADRGGKSEPLRWHGVFARMRLLRHVDERVLYCGSLVPRLWRLRHSSRSNVATKQTIKAFLTDTLEHGGLVEGDFRFHIDEDRYPEEEFVCQYRESHLDFLHRWLEREGLCYFFEHEPSENGNEILVIVDDKGQHGPLPGTGRVRYFPSGDDASAGEGLHDFQCDYQALPAGVLITDYNYANPSAPVEGDHAISNSGQGQIRDYGYRVFDEGEASRLAEVKAQSIACREMTVRAGGNIMALRAGYTFEIDDLGAEELPTEYLAYQVRHAGSLAGATADMAAMTGLKGNVTYHVEVQAIPKDTQYRAPQTTPWPRIYGFENAVVDGAAESEYAQIDEQGRYLIKFYFDASNLSDGVASTYIRMAQPHGGSSEGHHFPLRKGTEVMVAFLGGDPDRPLISGVVPNATHPSTVTSANHTENIIRTGGDNYIKFQDQKGKEYIHLFTPKRTELFMGGPTGAYYDDGTAYLQFPEPSGEGFTSPSLEDVPATFYVNTDGAAGFIVGGDWWQDVRGNMNVAVFGSVKHYFEGTHTLNIVGDSNDYYAAHHNTTIGTGRSDTVAAGGMTQTITGGLTQTVNDGGQQTVNGGWTHKVTAENHDDYGTWKTTSGAWNATFTGNVTLDAGSNVVTVNASEIKLNAPTVTTMCAEEKKKSDSWWDIYGSKGSFGQFKLDILNGKAAYTNLKLDVATVSLGSAMGKFGTYGASFDRKAIDKDTGALSIKQTAARIYTFGIWKM